MTWKRFKDRCAVHEKYGVQNHVGNLANLNHCMSSQILHQSSQF